MQNDFAEVLRSGCVVSEASLSNALSTGCTQVLPISCQALTVRSTSYTLVQKYYSDATQIDNTGFFVLSQPSSFK